MFTPAFVLSLLALAIPSIALVVMTVLYYRNWKHLQELQETHDWTRRGALHKAEAVLDEALMKAEKIVEQSQNKAGDILAETEAFSAKTEAKFDQAVNQVTSQQLREYHKLLTQSQQYLTSELNQVSHQLRETSNSALQQVQSQVQKELEMVMSAIQSQVTAQKNAQAALLDQYQAKLEAELQTKLAKILTESIHEVTGKSLSSADHHQIVLDVLQQAAERHTFELPGVANGAHQKPETYEVRHD